MKLFRKKIKVVQVCESECDNKLFTADIKGNEISFCCEKGFKKSLEDFTKELKK